jgi:hypothetical protein
MQFRRISGEVLVKQLGFNPVISFSLCPGSGNTLFFTSAMSGQAG